MFKIYYKTVDVKGIIKLIDQYIWYNRYIRNCNCNRRLFICSVLKWLLSL